MRKTKDLALWIITTEHNICFFIHLDKGMMQFNCSEVRVEGLETLDYLDNLLRGDRYTEQADAITFDSEVLSLFFL